MITVVISIPESLTNVSVSIANYKLASRKMQTSPAYGVHFLTHTMFKSWNLLLWLFKEQLVFEQKIKMSGFCQRISRLVSQILQENVPIPSWLYVLWRERVLIRLAIVLLTKAFSVQMSPDVWIRCKSFFTVFFF